MSPFHRLGVAAFAMFLFASFPAAAQNVRSWVSTSGLDTNDCTRSFPCRHFNRAINQTNPNGEVTVLDSGGYGSVVVTRAVSIVAPQGIHAAIAPTATGAIYVVHPSGGGSILLKNLFLNGQGGDVGVSIEGEADVVMQDLVISGFAISAVGTGFSGNASFKMRNCIIRNNVSGIYLSAYAEDARAVATIENVLVTETDFRAVLISAEGLNSRINTVARDVTAVKNGTGFWAFSLTSSIATLDLENCISTGNGLGLSAQANLGGNTLIRVSNSVITDNDSGVLDGGAFSIIASRKNNTVEGNDLNDTIADTFIAE